MIKVNKFRKVLISLIIFNLIYANLNPALFGLISYAQNDVAVEEEAKKEEKVINIEISEFSKNNMQEVETEYSEKVTININEDKNFSEVIIADRDSEISFEKEETEEIIEQEEVEVEEKIANTYYTSTKINLAELIEKIGEEGTLEIEYEELKQEVDENNKTENEEVVLEDENKVEIIEKTEEEDLKQEEKVQAENKEPKETSEKNEVNDKSENDKQEEIVEQDKTEETENVEQEETEKAENIIIAENGLVIINNLTQADEEGNVLIVYPENTYKLSIKIKTDVRQIEALEILNNKTIEKVSDLEKVKELKTVKNIVINGEEEILNAEETVTTPINYTKTLAELGIDTAQISTSVANKVNFTITMKTENVMYDLYKNPEFIIELPNEIEIINIDNTILLNNNNFEIEKIEKVLLENGNQALLIKLKGEQQEYTKSIEENMQIVLETTIATNNLIPTQEKTLILHYKNENVKTYDGIGISEEGLSIVPVLLVTDSKIMVATKAIVGENVTTSFEEDYKSVTIEPKTYNKVQIIGTVVNNTGANIENGKIVGKASNIGEISGIEKVYYTENVDATSNLSDENNKWQTEYTANAKKYLIVLDNFNQGQKIEFNYEIKLSENIEEDIKNDVEFTILTGEEEKTSKITIYQVAERLDIYEDEAIKATIVPENEFSEEIGQFTKYIVNISNISGQDLENIIVDVNMPEVLSKLSGNTDKQLNQAFMEFKGQVVTANINKLQRDESISIEVTGQVNEYVKAVETVSANIKYNEKNAKISTKMKVIEPSKIETTITSNKVGKALDGNEEIEYTVTLKNNGLSHSKINIDAPEINSMNIQKIEAINQTTGKRSCITAVDLKVGLTGVSIKPQEEVIVTITGVAKELKKDTIQNMYITISGESIQTVETAYMTNTINKTIVKQEENIKEEITETNNIQGIAWVDRNENGRKDKNEALLKGVKATLINTENSQEVATQITNSNGEYKFNNVEQGNYIVEFKYNTKALGVTEYKTEEVEENLDSDIITTIQDNKKTVKTEIISVEKGNKEVVNAGFVINKTYDMSINKGITKVTVDNKQGTKTYNFENTNMAKVEIDGKYLKGSLILVEYEIAVTNIGEVPGYAKLISDKMPEGMEFNSELNSNWYQENDGTLYSSALADKALEPGETAIIKLVLTKEMKDDKITSPVNKVKIEKTFNDYLIEDKNQGNDLSEATIIISLTTGNSQSYIWLITIVIAIIGIGVFGVYKVTTKKERGQS